MLKHQFAATVICISPRLNVVPSEYLVKELEFKSFSGIEVGSARNNAGNKDEFAIAARETDRAIGNIV